MPVAMTNNPIGQPGHGRQLGVEGGGHEGPGETYRGKPLAAGTSRTNKAKADYAEAISAKAERGEVIASAKAVRDAAKADNKSLPKPERKAANQAADQAFKDAKAAANGDYSAAVQAAKDAKSQAKAEYQASK